MESLQILSRSEMRNVNGGNMSLGCNGLCLVCKTPGGEESWCRPSGGGEADSECRDIYPAYEGGVSGDWATCGT